MPHTRRFTASRICMLVRDLMTKTISLLQALPSNFPSLSPSTPTFLSYPALSFFPFFIHAIETKRLHTVRTKLSSSYYLTYIRYTHDQYCRKKRNAHMLWLTIYELQNIEYRKVQIVCIVNEKKITKRLAINLIKSFHFAQKRL